VVRDRCMCHCDCCVFVSNTLVICQCVKLIASWVGQGQTNTACTSRYSTRRRHTHLHAVLRHALAAGESLQLLVRLRHAVPPHHRLNGLCQHLQATKIFSAHSGFAEYQRDRGNSVQVRRSLLTQQLM